MSSVSSQINGLNIMLPKISYPNGLPAESAKECILLFPNIVGVFAGMPMDDFEAVMIAATAIAKESFVSEFGYEFGDRRSETSPMRTVDVSNYDACVNSEDVKCA